mmetsp:Transcript_16193/g.56563  ORF Transcript_16193/g.56563 Transcript_16193/m.56563 type:complete len:208 (+) Transcript_16193:614-1237(+)
MAISRMRHRQEHQLTRRGRMTQMAQSYGRAPRRGGRRRSRSASRSPWISRLCRCNICSRPRCRRRGRKRTRWHATLCGPRPSRCSRLPWCLAAQSRLECRHTSWRPSWTRSRSRSSESWTLFSCASSSSSVRFGYSSTASATSSCGVGLGTSSTSAWLPCSSLRRSSRLPARVGRTRCGLNFLQVSSSGSCDCCGPSEFFGCCMSCA